MFHLSVLTELLKLLFSSDEFILTVCSLTDGETMETTESLISLEVLSLGLLVGRQADAETLWNDLVLFFYIESGLHLITHIAEVQRSEAYLKGIVLL